MWVYTLRLRGNRFYVGSTSRTPEVRFQEHVSGRGGSWTQKHPPIAIESYRELHTNDEREARRQEDCEVKRLMEAKGINNVRGGTYSEVCLPKHKSQTLLAELSHANGNCMRCGKAGHWARDCDDAADDWSDGDDSGSGWDSDDGDDSGGAAAGRCFRCGRTSHWADECYATFDVNGDRLSPPGASAMWAGKRRRGW